ncbi:MAG: hypothetical protein ABRQ26_11405 [Syntrophomonadaceae bacterium]
MGGKCRELSGNWYENYKEKATGGYSLPHNIKKMEKVAQQADAAIHPKLPK